MSKRHSKLETLYMITRKSTNSEQKKKKKPGWNSTQATLQNNRTFSEEQNLHATCTPPAKHLVILVTHVKNAQCHGHKGQRIIEMVDDKGNDVPLREGKVWCIKKCWQRCQAKGKLDSIQYCFYLEESTATQFNMSSFTKMECDYLNGWIKKAVTYANISPKMLNPTDTAGECRRRRRKCPETLCNVGKTNVYSLQSTIHCVQHESGR